MIENLGQSVRRKLKPVVFRAWMAYGYVAPRITLPGAEKLTVLIPSYSVERVPYVKANVRFLLKCDFVERVIVSNHNPETRIEDWVDFSDSRLTLVNQPNRRGCGYGWVVASEFDPEYLISIDDDILVRPRQIAKLFSHLLAEPNIPHGAVGVIGSDYYQSYTSDFDTMEVDNLYIMYAMTRAQLERYRELTGLLTQKCAVHAKSIEYWADDVVVSRTGSGRPKIHDVGRLFHLPTFNKPGVAIHKEPEFEQARRQVAATLDQLFATARHEPNPVHS
jgi:hypothetical protein